MQFEILELFRGHDVGSPVTSLTGHFRVVIHQFAIARHSFIVFDISDRPPALKIFAVEERPGLGPLLRYGPIDGMRLYARDHQSVGSIAALLNARELV